MRQSIDGLKFGNALMSEITEFGIDVFKFTSASYQFRVNGKIQDISILRHYFEKVGIFVNIRWEAMLNTYLGSLTDYNQESLAQDYGKDYGDLELSLIETALKYLNLCTQISKANHFYKYQTNEFAIHGINGENKPLFGKFKPLEETEYEISYEPIYSWDYNQHGKIFRWCFAPYFHKKSRGHSEIKENQYFAYYCREIFDPAKQIWISPVKESYINFEYCESDLNNYEIH